VGVVCGDWGTIVYFRIFEFSNFPILDSKFLSETILKV
jgi:hypothetical protein